MSLKIFGINARSAYSPVAFSCWQFESLMHLLSLWVSQTRWMRTWLCKNGSDQDINIERWQCCRISGNRAFAFPGLRPESPPGFSRPTFVVHSRGKTGWKAGLQDIQIMVLNLESNCNIVLTWNIHSAARPWSSQYLLARMTTKEEIPIWRQEDRI